MATERQMQQAQLDKLTAEVAKLIEETRKTKIEATLYPMVAGAALFGSIAAFVKVFF